MRLGGRLIGCGLCVVLMLAVASVPAFASLSWCTGGCPPGLSDNDHARAFCVTAGNEHVDLHDVHPKVGNTTVTGKVPAAEHNSAFDELPQ